MIAVPQLEADWGQSGAFCCEQQNHQNVDLKHESYPGWKNLHFSQCFPQKRSNANATLLGQAQPFPKAHIQSNKVILAEIQTFDKT